MNSGSQQQENPGSQPISIKVIKISKFEPVIL
jgi:hypothetical protein